MFRSTAPHRAGRDLLVRALAHKVQEQAFGSLSQSARRRLRSLAQPPGDAGNGADRSSPPASLRPGMRLVREWDRQVHEVLVREDGFDYRGEHYRSLTQVARRITGAHWSGPRFFGIAQAAKQRRPTAQGEAPAHASR